MSLSRWKWQLAVSPLRIHLRHLLIYFFIFLSASLSLQAFLNLESRILATKIVNLSGFLGGDVEIDFGYRSLDEAEQIFIAQSSYKQSESVFFLSMLAKKDSTAANARLARIRAVDQRYPLIGQLRTEPELNGGVYQTLSTREGMLGVFLTPNLVASLDVELDDIVLLGDVEFQYRGVIMQTPELPQMRDMFAPRALVSRAGLEAIRASSPDGLYQAKRYLLLRPSQSIAGFQELALEKFGENAWQMRDRKDMQIGEGDFLNAAHRIAALASALVALGYSIAIYALISVHLREDSATAEWLFTLGAKRGSYGMVVFLRWASIFVISAFILFPIIAYLGQKYLDFGQSFSPFQFPQISEQQYWQNVLKTLLLVGSLSLIIGSYAFLRLFARSTWQGWFWIIVLVLGYAAMFAVLFQFDLRDYTALLGFVGLCLVASFLAFLVLRIIKRLFGRNGTSSIALAELVASPKLTQSYLACLFASFVLSMFFLNTALAYRNLGQELRLDELPSHYLADILPEQRNNLETIARNQKVDMDMIPLARAHVVDFQSQSPLPPSHWIFRREQFFGFSETPPQGVTLVSGQWPNAQEFVLAASTASSLGLTIGDKLVLSSQGQLVTVTMTGTFDGALGSQQARFIMHLSTDMIDKFSHSYFASMDIDDQKAFDLANAIYQIMPNTIMISTREALDKLAAIIEIFSQALRMIAMQILIAASVAWMAVIILGFRQSRYRTDIFLSLGYSKNKLMIYQSKQLFILTFIAMIFALALIALIAPFVLNWLFDLKNNVPWLILVLASLLLIITAFFVSMLVYAIFLRQHDLNHIEEYAQDFHKLELDF